VVLKADAYGHGAVPIGRALEAAERPPDGLALATFDEAVELREAGLRLPMLVVFAVPAEHAAEAGRRRIAVTVGDDVLLERTLAAGGAHRTSSSCTSSSRPASGGAASRPRTWRPSAPGSRARRAFAWPGSGRTCRLLPTVAGPPGRRTA
jgi:Alanine racemase, N-terminal domain